MPPAAQVSVQSNPTATGVPPAVFEVESPPRGCSVNKGDASNLLTLVVMIAGILLKIHWPSDVGVDALLSFGLFGFAGGATNWLAVKMLFDKVPLLVGSGVIPRRFKEIRTAIKEMVMTMFFDRAFVEHYVAERAKGALANSLDMSAAVKIALDNPDVEGTLERALLSISETPDGAMLKSFAPMFGGMKGLVPKLKPIMVGFVDEVGGVLAEKIDPAHLINVNNVLEEIEKLLEEKLELLSPDAVKNLLSTVIREHLGWLVVWGNFFGGLIGLVVLVSGLKLGGHWDR